MELLPFTIGNLWDNTGIFLFKIDNIGARTKFK